MKKFNIEEIFRRIEHNFKYVIYDQKNDRLWCSTASYLFVPNKQTYVELSDDEGCRTVNTKRLKNFAYIGKK